MRAELEEYGGLLNLLSQQETAIVERAWDTVDALEHVIGAQQKELSARRKHRARMLDVLSQGSLTSSALAHVILLFPVPMRPLAEALTTEAVRLKKLTDRRIHYTRGVLDRARQLARSSEAAATRN